MILLLFATQRNTGFVIKKVLYSPFSDATETVAVQVVSSSDIDEIRLYIPDFPDFVLDDHSVAVSSVWLFDQLSVYTIYPAGVS